MTVMGICGDSCGKWEEGYAVFGLDGERSSVGFDELMVNLIMTDYSMPGMTGYELLKKIKGSSKLREIPVVIMSSENILARIDRCMEEGAKDFLAKPVKLSDVKRLRDFRGKETNERGKVTRKRKTLDKSCSPILPSDSLPSSINCDHTMSPISVSTSTHHHPLSKRPRLLSAD